MPRRIQLFLLVLAVALPVVMFGLAVVALFEREQGWAVEESMRRAARSAMDSVDFLLAADIAALEVMAAWVAGHVDNPEELHAQMARLRLQRAHWLDVRLDDAATGRRLLQATAPLGSGDLGRDEDGGVAMPPGGRAVVSPLRRTDPPGEVVVRVAVPHQQRARLHLSAAIAPEVFNGLLRGHGAPEGSVVALLDQTSTIVGRNHLAERFVGNKATDSLIKALSTRGDDHFFYATTQEGSRTYTAFSRSPRTGWVVAVGAPAGVVERASRRFNLLLAGAAAATLVLAAIVALLLHRSSARQREAERVLFKSRAEHDTERRLGDIAANFPGLIYRRRVEPDGRTSYPFLSGRIGDLGGTGTTTPRYRGSVGEMARALFAAEDCGQWEEAVQRSAATLEPFAVDARIRTRDGSIRWIRSIAQARRETDGAVIWDGVALDITEAKAVEQRLAASVVEKETLLREIHHRVRNNLQIIASLLHIEGMHIADQASRDRIDVVVQRINVLGRIHQQLYRSENLARIDFGQHLEELCGNLAELHGGTAPTATIMTEAAHLTCDIETAIPLGLIANELISNSLKHGFPADRGGRIDVAFRRDGDEVLLAIADNGVGMAAPPDSGTGMRLVEALVDQVEGRLSTESDHGTRIALRLPPEHFHD